MIVARISVGY